MKTVVIAYRKPLLYQRRTVVTPTTSLATLLSRGVRYSYFTLTGEAMQTLRQRSGNLLQVLLVSSKPFFSVPMSFLV